MQNKEIKTQIALTLFWEYTMQQKFRKIIPARTLKLKVEFCKLN